MNDGEHHQWYDALALSIDPTRGAAYDYVVNMLQDMVGVSEHDAMQDYTYFGLPAAGASPDSFEEYES